MVPTQPFLIMLLWGIEGVLITCFLLLWLLVFCCSDYLYSAALITCILLLWLLVFCCFDYLYSAALITCILLLWLLVFCCFDYLYSAALITCILLLWLLVFGCSDCLNSAALITCILLLWSLVFCCSDYLYSAALITYILLLWLLQLLWSLALCCFDLHFDAVSAHRMLLWTFKYCCSFPYKSDSLRTAAPNKMCENFPSASHVRSSIATTLLSISPKFLINFQPKKNFVPYSSEVVAKHLLYISGTYYWIFMSHFFQCTGWRRKNCSQLSHPFNGPQGSQPSAPRKWR